MKRRTEASSELPDLDSLWDFNDPAASEARFREALAAEESGGDVAYALEVRTQIARALGLKRRFDAAHAVLDEVEAKLTDGMAAARVRHLLERGRVFNSSGRKDEALPLFIEAWERAREANGVMDGLAVDAAHMVAIAKGGGSDDVMAWNLKALELAESSSDPKARKWLASLHNNIGWTHHAKGEFEKALRHFERALEEQITKGDAHLIRVAKWCVARCYRSLGRIEEALAMQRELEAEHAAASQDRADGFVCEEIAECLRALGRTGEARPYFTRAYELLSQDAWFVEAEPKRLERLRQYTPDSECS